MSDLINYLRNAKNANCNIAVNLFDMIKKRYKSLPLIFQDNGRKGIIVSWPGYDLLCQIKCHHVYVQVKRRIVYYDDAPYASFVFSENQLYHASQQINTILMMN